MPNSPQSVLVTGGAGYIGSHTCKALCEAGYMPVTLDNLSRGNRWAVQWGPLEVGDIRDTLRVEAIIKRYRPVALLHFAAFAYVGESVDHPDRYYDNNLSGSAAVINTALQNGLTHIINSSSCATYGLPQELPITEAHRQHPVNPYGRTKLAVEHLLEDYGTAYGLKWATLRYFNAAGADPALDIGEHHAPETHLIPNIFSALSGRKESIVVHGADYATPDGTCVRDYVHVTDLADAHVKALQHLMDKKASIAVNLGSGKGFSIQEIIHHAEMVTGRTVPVEFGPRRAGDPPVLVAACEKARSILNWTPRHSAIETILETAWAWHEKSAEIISSQGGSD